MLRIRLSPDDPRIDVLEPAVSALRSGGVVAFPTETFYGLAADPRSALAVKRLFSIKQRMADQAIPLIAAGLAQVRDHVGTMTPLAERLAVQGWPGPLTLLIPASPLLCADVHRATGKVAVRVPGHAMARLLAEAAGHAVTSTSANVSGQPPASTPEQVVVTLSEHIDVLIDAGPTPAGLPSTIVDATSDAPVLIRPGVVPWDRVLEFLHR